MNFDINLLSGLMSALSGNNSNPIEMMTKLMSSGILGAKKEPETNNNFNKTDSKSENNTQNSPFGALGTMLPLMMTMMNKGQGGNSLGTIINMMSMMNGKDQTNNSENKTDEAKEAQFSNYDATCPNEDEYDKGKTQFGKTDNRNPQNSNPQFTRRAQAYSAPHNPFERIGFAGAEVTYLMQKLKSRA